MPDFAMLADLGIVLTEEMKTQLAAYHRLLLLHNARMDLTNVPEAEMTLRHYADSLLVLRQGLIQEGDRIIDVGTGAGFPGLPLAIARPDCSISLLESKQKRCDFLETVVSELGLKNVQILRGRAEDYAKPPHREAYELAVARAVAPLNLLLEYLLPYVKVGGAALCWKGPAVYEEQAAGQRAAQLLGGQLGEVIDLKMPGRSHLIQVVRKVMPTHKKYPRKAGTPGKDPLGLQA